MSSQGSYDWLQHINDDEGSSQDSSFSDATNLILSNPSMVSPDQSPGYNKREEILYSLFGEEGMAEMALQKIPSVEHEWCRLVTGATNKPSDKFVESLVDRQGYYQVSLNGANKVS